MNKEGKEIYLGLDVSTACIGISIIIDDGSSDGSSDICKNYVSKDSRIAYYKKPYALYQKIISE